MRQYRCLIILIMKGNIFIRYITTYIGQWFCIFGILNIRLCLDHIEKSAKSGQALLHHFCQLNQDLDRADEDSDVQGIHGKICCFHFSVCDQPSAKDQGHQIHQSLEKQIAAHKTSHTTIVRIFGYQKSFVALLKFLPLNLLICKRLYDTNPGKGILKSRIDISDLASVIHERCLHTAILTQGKDQHQHNQKQKRHCQSPVDKK